MFPFSTLRGHPEPGTFQPGTRSPIPVPGNRKPGAPGNPESAHEQHIRPATRGSTNERPKRSLTRMASRLRPTPETGTVAATKMPASSIGPSWAQRGSREARLAFRQAQKRGDREGAMRIAGAADKQGLASQASIGSAEERLAGEYQGRGADTAVTAEIETALTPPGPGRADGQPRSTMQEQPKIVMAGGGTSAASRFQQSQDVIGNTAVKTVQPSIPEQPPAPGASQPPENPVSGSSTPVTGDPESRLGMRKPGRIGGMPADKAIGDAQSRVDAIPGRDKPSTSGAAGSDDDFLDRVSALTSAEGGDMFRGAAVKQANAERVAAGKAPRNYDDMIGGLQTRDREAEAAKRTGSALNRGPVLSVDPDLARSFRAAAPAAQAKADAGAAERAAAAAERAASLERAAAAARATPSPSRSAAVGGSPASPPVPFGAPGYIRKAGDPRLYGKQLRADNITTVDIPDIGGGLRAITAPIRKLGQSIGGAVERRAEENRISARKYLEAETAAEELRKARLRIKP